MDNVWSESLSSFLQIVMLAAVNLVLVPAAVYAIKWLKAKALEAKGQLPSDLVFWMESAARIAVDAAEQSGLANLIEAEGKAKKDWALDYAENLLKQQCGLVLDLDSLGASWWAGVVDALDGAIEAEVGRRNGIFSPEQHAMVSANDLRSAGK